MRVEEIPILINEELWSQIAIDHCDQERVRLQQLLRRQKQSADRALDTDVETD